MKISLKAVCSFSSKVLWLVVCLQIVFISTFGKELTSEENTLTKSQISFNKMNSSKNAINSLQEWMKGKDLEAFLVPIADPHGSEYVAEHYHNLKWLCGFSGSAGTLLVTQNNVVFWTDSRYHLQAEKQLDADIILMKEKSPSLADISSWICENMQRGNRIGVDGSLFSFSDIETFSTCLSHKGIKIETQFDPFETIWKNRPLTPPYPFFLYSTSEAGESSESKLKRLRSSLEEKRAEGILLSDLYEIAWLLNIRGNDVEFNPVGTAYLYLTDERGYFFVEEKKIPSEVLHYLEDLGMELRAYSSICSFLRSIPQKRILCDKNKTSFRLVSSLPNTCEVISEVSPLSLFKAIKNDVEIRGTEKAMLKDGVALVKCFRWLEENISKGGVTEYGFAQKLLEIKQGVEGFVEESFSTIAGYTANGAIVHYQPDKENSAMLSPRGFLLVDCGTQYVSGTTDITRTIAIGPLTEQQRKDYTLVLKGHIAMALLQFPKGTKGIQIDAFAHYNLWRQGLDYYHGTSHGVGHFLGVHEGPQAVNGRNQIPLQSGMILSNEPGLYRTDEYGIRIENLVEVVPAGETEFGDFLKFRNLTLFPYERKAIVKEMLTEEEINYINEYHKEVYRKLSPLLNSTDKEWLMEKTKEL